MAAEHSRRNSGGFFFIFVVFNTETNLTIHVLITISFLFFLGVFFFVFSIIEKKDEQIPRKISLKKKVSFFFVLVNRQEKDERFFCKIYFIFFKCDTVVCKVFFLGSSSRKRFPKFVRQFY